METHIIHKPSHHQERLPASPVGHRPYNNRYPPPATKRRGLRDRFPHMLLSPTIVPPSETEGITAGPELLLPTGAFPIALTETGNHIWFAWTHCECPFWVEHMRVLFERLVWQDILTGKTAMHILIGHCAQTNCSDKTYVLFVRIFRSDTLKGHADRREVGTFWKSNERG